MRLNRRVPVGMHGGVRGRLPGTGASYSITPGIDTECDFGEQVLRRHSKHIFPLALKFSHSSGKALRIRWREFWVYAFRKWIVTLDILLESKLSASISSITIRLPELWAKRD